MNVFRPKSRVQAYAFARGSTVHHTNYFGQPETAREIRKFLKF
jgi:hypothetical protein